MQFVGWRVAGIEKERREVIGLTPMSPRLLSGSLQSVGKGMENDLPITLQLIEKRTKLVSHKQIK